MMLKLSREDNFAWLLLALMLLLFSSSLFSQLRLQGARLLVDIGLVLVVIAAVWSLHTSRSRLFVPKIFVAVFIIGLMIVDNSIESHVLALTQLFAAFLFLGMTIHIAWQQVMFTGEVTRNTIVGAICIYILIGLWFGFAYLIVEYFFPGSINGLNSNFCQENLGEMTYFSMVTLTTLGYGDITPAAPITRFLPFMEATIGIFYTTVLVASLIGLRLSAYRPDNHK